VRGALLAASVGLGAFACGPSFQAVYECDVRFEHCYALDQGAASVDAKKGCWRDWLHGYTYGQPRDRVEYAATRFSELSLDPTLPNEDIQSARPRRPERTTGPVPTNAFAPPPNISEHPDASAPTKSVAVEVPLHDVMTQAPGADCADACAQKWNACRTGCKDRACEACDKTYRSCMPVCFHEEPAGPQKPPRAVH
jgi:hypothetical protein